MIFIRGEAWAHKFSVTLPLFIEVLVSSQKSGHSCLCILGVSPLTILHFFDFGTVPTVQYVFLISRLMFVLFDS